MNKNKTKKKSAFVLANAEKKLLEKIAKKVRRDLHDLDKPLEWLAWESELARSTIQRVLDAERNVGIITLDRICKSLGYTGIAKFLETI